MRWWARLAVAVAALAIAAPLALAFVAPRYARSDAMRAFVTAAARRVVDRDFRYDDLALKLLPPLLVIEGAQVAGATPEAEPWLEADRLELHLVSEGLRRHEWWIEPVVVRGATLRLRRGSHGLDLPALGAGAAADAPPLEPPPLPWIGGGDWRLRWGGLRVEGASVHWVDESFWPSVQWSLQDVSFQARGGALDEPFDVEWVVHAAGGGSASGSGVATLDGDFEWQVELADFPVAPAAPYVPGVAGLAGTLDGSVATTVRRGAPRSVRADLEWTQASASLAGVELRGPVHVILDASADTEAAEVGFEVEATRADVRYLDAVHKPPGTRGSMKGRYERAPNGSWRVVWDELRLHEADTGPARGERIRLEIPIDPS